MQNEYFYRQILDSFLESIDNHEHKSELCLYIQEFLNKKEMEISNNQRSNIRKLVNNDESILGMMYLIIGIILKEENPSLKYSIQALNSFITALRFKKDFSPEIIAYLKEAFNHVDFPLLTYYFFLLLKEQNCLEDSELKSVETSLSNLISMKQGFAKVLEYENNYNTEKIKIEE